MPFCSRCGEVLDVEDKFCPKCGTPVGRKDLFTENDAYRFDEPEPVEHTEVPEKGEFTAAVLSFILPGLGYMYCSRFWSGVGCMLTCLFIDFILIMLAPEAVDPVTLEMYYDFECMIPVYLCVRLLYSVVFAVGSYNVARTYNRELRESGTPPW